ncbi:hypothetical protein, partial [Paracoccus sanguinis]
MSGAVARGGAGLRAGGWAAAAALVAAGHLAAGAWALRHAPPPLPALPEAFEIELAPPEVDPPGHAAPGGAMDGGA